MDSNSIETILQRITSVVCLTNFVSEVWSSLNHNDEIKGWILSMKRRQGGVACHSQLSN